MSAVATSRIARPALARSIADALENGSVVLTAAAGYGKTMALDEALEEGGLRSVWIACGQTGGDGGRLLMALVEGLRAVIPGAADVLADRLSAGVEPVDVAAATTGLLAELEQLLVERLVVVFDDAEKLDDSAPALALVDQLLGSRVTALSLAIATRRPLSLRLAKLRAAGRLVEVGAAALALTPAEAEELLQLRHGRAPSEEEVDAALAATEGWPMGLALTGLKPTTNGDGAPMTHDELFQYLAEEVLDGLEPALRSALVDSSVPAVLTPELVDDLGLPATFLEQVERLGLFLRGREGSRSYHPLFRTFLLEQLEHLRTPEERAALHARAAASVAARGGSHSERIEHLLAAGDYDSALAVIGDHAQDLLRCAPDSVEAWLARLPLRMHDVPMYLLLNARRLWGAGNIEQALPSLRAAVSGFHVVRDSYNEWLTRLLLADAFVSVGAYDDVAPLMDGWQDGPGAGVAIAWYEVIALTATGRIDEAEALASRLRSDPRTAVPFRHLDDIARVGAEPAAGRARETLARLSQTVGQLEQGDPHGRLPYTMAMVVLVLRDLGEYEAAMEWLDRCERESVRAGMGFVERDCQLQRAFILARDGELARAELELAHAGARRGSGWRGAHRGEAEAKVASLRGDSAEAVVAALSALDRVLPGPICYRVWCALEMAPVLAENGAPDAARDAITTALAVLDRGFPHEHGRLHRARLFAARACLEYDAGELEATAESIAWTWEEAGDQADQVVRAHWPALQPALWHALAAGTIEPDIVLSSLQRAFPNGEALVAMIDHPDPGVRRAALSTALAANHPVVLARLAALSNDDDAQVAAAAVATGERLKSQAPALRFEMLGGFHVLRAGWELDSSVWDRPMAVRVVRFLLLQDGGAVPEDVLFEAFWADRPADSARQHLAVAVSRARKVLDLPGAESSVIEVKERTYRLRLRERDSIDAADFTEAARNALSEQGPGRRSALERATDLWTGEPLPEDRYAPWTFAWRERLAETYGHVLNALVETYGAAGEHHHAVRVAQALLELDPLNEGAHRQLIVAYARTGRTSHALRQYLECRRALVVGLGVEPSAETARLQARVLAGDPV